MTHPEHEAVAEEMRAELNQTRDNLTLWLDQPQCPIVSGGHQTYDYRDQRTMELRVAIINLEKAIALLEQGLNECSTQEINCPAADSASLAVCGREYGTDPEMN